MKNPEPIINGPDFFLTSDTKNNNSNISITPLNTDIKSKVEKGISEYNLVGMERVNGYTVKNYVPVIPEKTRKKIIQDTIVNLLGEYNRLEIEKLKNHEVGLF